VVSGECERERERECECECEYECVVCVMIASVGECVAASLSVCVSVLLVLF
jgi:hypothetical protein